MKRVPFEEQKKLNRSFEESHRLGAQEFLSLWLFANEQAIEAAQYCGFDTSDLRTKTLLSLATLKILRKAKQVL